MTILALYKLLLYGGFALLVGSLVALEVFLNWKYPLPPRLRVFRRPDRSERSGETSLVNASSLWQQRKRRFSAPLGVTKDLRPVSFRR